MTETVPGPQVRFVPAGPTSRKVACTVCGRIGWGPLEPGEDAYPWQANCMKGHGRCPKCGEWTPVKKNGTARVHARCPL